MGRDNETKGCFGLYLLLTLAIHRKGYLYLTHWLYFNVFASSLPKDTSYILMQMKGEARITSLAYAKTLEVLYSCLPKEIYRAPRILSVLFFLTFTWISWWWRFFLMMNNLKMRWECCLVFRFVWSYGKPDWGCLWDDIQIFIYFLGK